MSRKETGNGLRESRYHNRIGTGEPGDAKRRGTDSQLDLVAILQQKGDAEIQTALGSDDSRCVDSRMLRSVISVDPKGRERLAECFDRPAKALDLTDQIR